jgi:cytochrome c oxidase subunit 2
MEGFWQMPENVSTFGGDIDRLFLIVAWITGIVFVLVEALLIYYLVKYRHRDGRKAVYTHGNSRMEIAWTAATAVIVIVVGVLSRGLWMDIKDPRRFPEGGIEVRVVAKQFEWNVTYPGADGQLDTGDDFVKRNQLHVPVNTVVRVQLRAEDVIHSFFLPHLRLKQDAVPGMTIPAWFEATTPGEYVIGCAELCGLGHYRMRGTMTVLADGEWDSWYRQEQQAVAAAAAGSGAAPLAQMDEPATPPAAAATVTASHAH